MDAMLRDMLNAGLAAEEIDEGCRTAAAIYSRVEDPDKKRASVPPPERRFR
jgi:hypothetical protein